VIDEAVVESGPLVRFESSLFDSGDVSHAVGSDRWFGLFFQVLDELPERANNLDWKETKIDGKVEKRPQRNDRFPKGALVLSKPSLASSGKGTLRYPFFKTLRDGPYRQRIYHPCNLSRSGTWPKGGVTLFRPFGRAVVFGADA